MSKNRLEVDYDFDFTLLGLNANVKPHKIAWHLNTKEGFNFVRQPELRIDFKGDKHISIVNYLHENDYSTFRILKNRSEFNEDAYHAFLLPELKQFDYLIMLENESSNFDENIFFNKIREIPFVQFAIKVDLNNLKSRDNLIF